MVVKGAIFFIMTITGCCLINAYILAADSSSVYKYILYLYISLYSIFYKKTK